MDRTIKDDNVTSVVAKFCQSCWPRRICYENVIGRTIMLSQLAEVVV